MFKHKHILRNFLKNISIYTILQLLLTVTSYKCNVCCPISKWTPNRYDDDDDVCMVGDPKSVHDFTQVNCGGRILFQHALSPVQFVRWAVSPSFSAWVALEGRRRQLRCITSLSALPFGHAFTSPLQYAVSQHHPRRYGASIPAPAHRQRSTSTGRRNIAMLQRHNQSVIRKRNSRPSAVAEKLRDATRYSKMSLRIKCHKMLPNRHITNVIIILYTCFFDIFAFKVIKCRNKFLFSG